MALLPVFDFPAPVIDRAEQKAYWTTPGELSSDEIREVVERFAGNHAMNLGQKASWPLDEPLSVADKKYRAENKHRDGMQSLTCRECEVRFTFKGDQRCGDLDCFDRKEEAWAVQRLETASQALNLPYLTLEEVGSLGYSGWDYLGSGRDYAQERFERKCECLRLIYEEANYYFHPEGFGDIGIRCCYKLCAMKDYACLAELKEGAEPPDTRALLEKRSKERLLGEIINPAVRQIMQKNILHGAGYRPFLALLLSKMSHRFEFEKVKDWDYDMVRRKIGRYLVEDALPWSPEGRLEESLENVNELLEYLKLEPLALKEEADPAHAWLRRFEQVRDWIHRRSKPWAVDPRP